MSQAPQSNRPYFHLLSAWRSTECSPGHRRHPHYTDKISGLDRSHQPTATETTPGLPFPRAGVTGHTAALPLSHAATYRHICPSFSVLILATPVYTCQSPSVHTKGIGP